MSFDGFDDFEDEDWEDTPEEQEVIKEAEFVKDDPEEKTPGSNVGLVGEQWAGKSLIMTLFGYLNTDYFGKFDVKENFPNVYTLIKEGYVPEVEELHIIDLDASYKKRSKSDIFGRLVKDLYKDKRISRTTIKIPKIQVDLANSEMRRIVAIKIDQTKLKIENTITAEVKDCDESIMLGIDSMSSYDELLNDKFRVLFESALADKKELGASLKGIKQNKWVIRNGWWQETLRDKRTFPGWQVDTYKQEEKSGLWLEKEINSAKKYDWKKEEDILPYKVMWAPRTEFDLDQVWYLRNDGVNDYWVNAAARSKGKEKPKDLGEIHYTKNRRSAIYEILEELAPKMMGIVEEDGNVLSDDELWI